MEEIKTCKACLLDKEVTQFYESKNLKSGRLNICKDCCKLKRRIKDSQLPKLDDTFPKNSFRLYYVSKEDYSSMYDLIRGLGYDSNKGDIHEQFLDKWNSKIKKKMYEKVRPSNSLNAYLPNGERNPDY